MNKSCDYKVESLVGTPQLTREEFHKEYPNTSIRQYYEYCAEWNRSNKVHGICGWCNADNGLEGSLRGLLSECWDCGGN